MFILKTFINEKQIREIQVRNTGKRTVFGDYFYVVEKPEYPNGIRKIVHDREKGDLALAIKALQLVQRNEPRFREEEEEEEGKSDY